MPTPTVRLPAHLKLVLLDRDGVINHDSEQFIKHPDEWQPIAGSVSAIVALQAKYEVAICTNQSGLGRGLFDEDALDQIHNKLANAVEQAGGRPPTIFYCPHHPDDGCECRKPLPGLLHSALDFFKQSPEETIYVGDSARDLEAAVAADCAPILVLTGNGRKTQASLDSATDQVPTFASLAALAAAIT